MSRNSPITARDVRAGLKAAGFTKRKQKSTSHEHWVKDTVLNGEPHRRKVTVDEPKSPFSDILIHSMANQAGMTVKQFRQLCTKDGAKKAKRGLLSWLQSN